MFDINFYPTPRNVIETMTHGLDIEGKIFLEPSAGKGDIVKYLLEFGAKDVIACEKNYELRRLLDCTVSPRTDFMEMKSEEISHIDAIVMNPPFAADSKHILHAWSIAPAGCEIIALCNLNTVRNASIYGRAELELIINEHGHWENLGECFSQSERKTNVDVAMIRLKKPGESYENEFNGFFMEDEPEEQVIGLMPYNVVRDLVNRYVEAVKLFDSQMEVGIKMNDLIGPFFSAELAFTCTEKGKAVTRNNFKKQLQKSAWSYVIKGMNLHQYSTKKLKEDINNFVETQTKVPFTMKNIYRMVEIIIGTNEARMNKALEEVFDKLTRHYDENRYHVEGWKTNSHYLINQKFILPYMTERGWSGELRTRYNGNCEDIEDMVKALCWLTGQKYDYRHSLSNFVNNRRDENNESIRLKFGQWYDWGFFEIKGFKKSTMHFKFKDPRVWELFNQRIAKIKGYVLYENAA